VREANGDTVDVTIDGRVVGPAPWDGDVPAGAHTVALGPPNMAAGPARPFSLERKQRLDLSIEARSTQGHVRITTSPASASITFDGRAVGTGSYDADVPPGRHTIGIVAPGKEHEVREVSVERGQFVVEDITLNDRRSVPVYRGFEGRWDLGFTLAPGAGHYELPPAAAMDAGPTPLSAPMPLGVSIDLRLGYAFDWYAVEFFGMFQFSFVEDHLPFPKGMGGGSGFGLGSDGPKGIFGVAARATSKTETVRVTGSLGFGLSVADVIFTVSPETSTYKANPGYVAPALVADVGILVGGAPPGRKFFIGVEAWEEFISTLDVGPYHGPSFVVPYEDAPQTHGFQAAYGPIFFFGPVIGMGFGH
jgi:hypothetical protein